MTEISELCGLTVSGDSQRLRFICENGEYVQFYIGFPYTGNKEIEISKIQIEEGTVATEYEPYKEPQEITLPHTLPGIPVVSGGNYTDENGQQWICDEIDLAKGVHVQRVISISDFTLIQNSNAVSHYRHSDVNRILIGGDTAPTMCNITDVYAVSTSTNSVHYYVNFSGTAINVYVPVGYDIIANPLEVLAVLATPIETPLSDAEIAAFKALRSNKPTTTILNDSGAFMGLEYVADTKTYIDNLLKG